MAALFALGVMSIGWMVFVAGLIAVEKLLPWRWAANWSVTAVLVVVGVALLIDPSVVPGMPDTNAPMQPMNSMDAMH
jgi:predicted metal-binding membrane protein